MEKILEYPLFRKLWDKYGYNIFVLLGITGIAMIFISELNFDSKYKSNEKSNDIYSYRQQLESDLTDLLSSVNGAGDVKVMITLESGEENVYAWQEKSSLDEQTVSADTSNQMSQHTLYENEIVMIDSGNEKKALIEKVLQPAVQGVVVVCKGADDIKVVSDITNAVSVALNMPSNRICVIKMQ